MKLLAWLAQYIGTHSQRELARARRVLAGVDRVGEQVHRETDRRLQERALLLRQRAARGASLDDLLEETFAVVREVSHRQVGLRHFDEQVLGGVAMHQGHIAEMKTGEGKTLAATLPVVLHALAGEGAHVITVNDYLAERDAEWMGPVFRAMGLTVGVILEEMEEKARQAAYAADVTYVTNSELVFDYLRDNLASSRDEQVHRPFHFALVDEFDLLLLDEAGTPLVISGSTEEPARLAEAARRVVAPLVEGEDFRVDHKSRHAAIEEAGWSKVEAALGIDNLAAAEQIDWQHALHNALLAHAVYRRDVDYIVRHGEILLVDDYTGRVSPDKRFSDGLHQALQAKEGVAVQAEDRTLAKVSYQMFFRLYPFLCGMTGTAYSAREEIGRTYGLRVVMVPTHEPAIREDEPSVVFKTSVEKLEAAVLLIRDLIAGGRPVLVGTTSVLESEQVSRLLSQQGIEHAVLNAKDDRSEAAIIAQAGRGGAVTVSTTMAGRGVDILLGGNPEGLDGEREDLVRRCRADRERVVAAGGLMVIGTGLHESRRIDDQLRGRAGRQGDPGGSQYFLSLDDPIYRKFGERIRGHPILAEVHQRLREHPRGEPVLEQSVLRTLRDLRLKVEIENEAARREVLRYDVIIDQQRRTIYAWRQTVLVGTPGETVSLLREMAAELTARWRERLASGDDDASAAVRSEMTATLGETVRDPEPGGVAALDRLFADLEAAIGTEQLAEIAGQVTLSVVDSKWTDHLGALEQVDDAVGLRGYGQLDPLLEFRREAHALFEVMLHEIRRESVAAVLSVAR